MSPTYYIIGAAVAFPSTFLAILYWFYRSQNHFRNEYDYLLWEEIAWFTTLSLVFAAVLTVLWPILLGVGTALGLFVLVVKTTVLPLFDKIEDRRFRRRARGTT
jgi:O-antigen/teichoic acid export membrane protein